MPSLSATRKTPLWIGLHLPMLSLDTLFPLWPTDTPLAAVLHHERACALTPAALAQGLEPGMRRSTLSSLAPGLVLKARDRPAEEQRLRRIALELLQYTPHIAFDPAQAADTLLLEISASLSLFKGPRNLCRRLHATLRQQRTLHYRLSMAPTAQGAKILASQNQTSLRRVLQASTLGRRLDPLPVSLLAPSPAHLEWLEGLGCRTLARLRRLPREGVQQRSDPALVQALDAAYGRIPEAHAWFTPPELFSWRSELAEHLEHAHAILAAAERLIEHLCAWLHARQCAADTLVFLLHHEKGRHALPPDRLVLSLSQAGWRPGDFMRVLAERLRLFTLCSPVIALELSIPATQPRPEPSGSLFPEPAQWQADELRLLDLLRARLGTEHVLEPRPCADHRPERANIWAPVGPAPASLNSAPKAEAALQGPQTRPFWMLPQPQALETRNNRPVYKGVALRLVRGPERIESGWWESSRGEQRDYFVAQDPNFARYWIYRQRESLEARWFLHGLFG